MKKTIFATILFVFGMLNVKAISNEKYYKTTYENNVYRVEEINDETYNNVNFSQLSNDYVETEYKKVSLNVLDDIIKLNIEWKKTPKIKSYDVIAVMSEGVTFNTNSIIGYQSATLTNDHQLVHYNMATQNTKLFNNGVGISMNLIDSAIYYNLSLRDRKSVV